MNKVRVSAIVDICALCVSLNKKDNTNPNRKFNIRPINAVSTDEIFREQLPTFPENNFSIDLQANRQFES